VVVAEWSGLSHASAQKDIGREELRLRLGLLIRLFTASRGVPDVGEPDVDGAAAKAVFAPVHSLPNFERKLDIAAKLGLARIELTQAGDPSGAEYLLEHPPARRRLVAALESRGLSIAALNCSGMPLHPVEGPRYRHVIRQTFRLAGELGISTVVSMSGVSGDGADASTINWVFFPWPESSVALARRQWEAVVALWGDLAQEARINGVTQIALELHPLHLVYNVPSLLRLREAVGQTIGATVDPSHLIWQQMDPVEVVQALGSAVFHVQLKDTAFDRDELAIAGVLDDRPFGGPRAWVNRTIGRGHDSDWWLRFLRSLVSEGYQGVAAIENEDPEQSYEEGICEAARFLRPLVAEAINA
jgi:sugar phosphate isomerase/epimerase